MVECNVRYSFVNMELPVCTYSQLELYSVICSLTAEKYIALEIHELLMWVYGEAGCMEKPSPYTHNFQYCIFLSGKKTNNTTQF